MTPGYADPPAGVTPAAAVTLARATAVDPLVSVPVRVGGKFLFAGDAKLYLRGVTYGTFRSGADSPVLGHDYPDDATLEADFAAMQQHGVNTVRCYTVPPTRLLDAAARHGLRVMVGLPWEQHVAFLDDAGRADAIERLQGLVDKASIAPVYRVPTRPTRASKERRLEGKRQRSALKRGRGSSGED